MRDMFWTVFTIAVYCGVPVALWVLIKGACE